MTQIDEFQLPFESKLTHFGRIGSGVVISAFKDGIYKDNTLVFRDNLTTWYKSVHILGNEGENLIIVCGTNRGLMEIIKVNNEVTTVKTWFLNTPITKVTQIGPFNFLCLDFVSQRVVTISTTEEPSEIRHMTTDFQFTDVKKPLRSDPITLAPNVCKEESWTKIRVEDFWPLNDRYFILSSKQQIWVWDLLSAGLAPRVYWNKLTDEDNKQEKNWSWSVSFTKQQGCDLGTLCITQYTIQLEETQTIISISNNKVGRLFKN